MCCRSECGDTTTMDRKPPWPQTDSEPFPPSSHHEIQLPQRGIKCWAFPSGSSKGLNRDGPEPRAAHARGAGRLRAQWLPTTPVGNLRRHRDPSRDEHPVHDIETGKEPPSQLPDNAPAAAGTHQKTSDPARDAHYTETGKEPPSQLPAAVHK